MSNFDYLDKLLTDWHERKLKTSSEVEAFLAEMKQKNKNIKGYEDKEVYFARERDAYSMV